MECDSIIIKNIVITFLSAVETIFYSGTSNIRKKYYSHVESLNLSSGGCLLPEVYKFPA